MNESAFSSSQLIRFFQKLAQKIGGWGRISSTALIGVCRGLFAWSDLTGVGYIAAGTEQRLEVWTGGVIYDITPIYATDDLSSPLSTYSGQATIIVHDATTSPSVGDWIYIATTTSIANLLFQGFYQVTSVLNSSHYTFVAGSNATSTVAGGGTTALFFV